MSAGPAGGNPPGGGPRPLRVSAAAWGRVLAHVAAERPREAVGYLGGPDGTATRAVPLRNLGLPGTGPRRSFLADPRDQYAVERAWKDGGVELLAVYHSHPGGGTGLSAADRRLAVDDGRALLVLAPPPAGREDPTRRRAWRRRGEAWAPVPLVVEGEGPTTAGGGRG